MFPERSQHPGEEDFSGWFLLSWYKGVPPARQCVKNVFVHLILWETRKIKSIVLAYREGLFYIHEIGYHMGTQGLVFTSSHENTTAITEALPSDFFLSGSPPLYLISWCHQGG